MRSLKVQGEKVASANGHVQNHDRVRLAILVNNQVAIGYETPYTRLEILAAPPHCRVTREQSKARRNSVDHPVGSRDTAALPSDL